ncbi:hypothetical protein HJC23_008769 [Cyclotella cryptica]|uniref:Iron hydrogenase large subunit C-terminal domain-containing protein n=1 Tax=Cyclotella cryptica TaxID=29204 RepID=A0ABD3PF18_9STRA|eukprot:CCRYP_015667-RA/>CCRYP_015667-RA protein AED:0.40 eAED:0.40 QI:0/-1/0/1/-1/1/1/0/795
MPVFLNNIDDYLGPSQACVNPLFTAPSNSTHAKTSSTAVPNNDQASANVSSDAGADANNEAGKVLQSRRRVKHRPPPPNIQNEEDTHQRKQPIRLLHNTDDGFVKSETNAIDSNPPSTKKKSKATVTLSDCLSCSGCVTSAEAVLMSHHSVEKLREVAMSQKSAVDRKHIVFTVSAASLADLYRHIYLELEGSSNLNNEESNSCNGFLARAPSNPSRYEFLRSIADFLYSRFGVEMVVDGAVTQQISLLESANEFCYRYKQEQIRKEKEDSPSIKTNCDISSIALSSTQTRYIKKESTVDGSPEVTEEYHPPGLLLVGDDDYSKVVTKNVQNGIIDNVAYGQQQSPGLPMLASSCPGFVCLVEKTAAPVVPLLSSAKSPMAAAGTLIKSGMLGTSCDASANGKTSGLSDGQCFHVAVMPCHDKKLEAGRNDFAWERQTLLKYSSQAKNTETTASTNDIVNEVDLVLTTGELLEILSSAAENTLENRPSGDHSSIHAIRELLASLKPSAESQTSQRSCPVITDLDLLDSEPTLHESQNNQELDVGVHGSGSYADFIFRYAAWSLFGCELSPHKPLPWKGSTSSNVTMNSVDKTSGVRRRRSRRQDNTDLRSITLYKHSDGSYSCDEENPSCRQSTPVLNFATAYGFKNVQLILQSLSKDGYTAGALDVKGYDYVEVMACPSGCPNGGGQIGAMGQRETPKETKERVKRTSSLIPIVRPNCGKGTVGTIASSLFGVCDGVARTGDNNDRLQPAVSSFKDGCFGQSSRRMLHTRFHIVPKLELSTGATAGVALSDTKW